MSVRATSCVAVLTLVLFSLSCRRLPERATGEGALALDTLSSTESVPYDWGSLVSVTTQPASPNRFQLWFQDEAGNVRMVLFDTSLNQLVWDATLITRQ